MEILNNVPSKAFMLQFRVHLALLCTIPPIAEVTRIFIYLDFSFLTAIYFNPALKFFISQSLSLKEKNFHFRA